MGLFLLFILIPPTVHCVAIAFPIFILVNLLLFFSGIYSFLPSFCIILGMLAGIQLALHSCNILLSLANAMSIQPTTYRIFETSFQFGF